MLAIEIAMKLQRGSRRVAVLFL